jgi:hypothetical protein
VRVTVKSLIGISPVVGVAGYAPDRGAELGTQAYLLLIGYRIGR